MFLDSCSTEVRLISANLALEGKVALVTGATKGIGYGIAKGLAEAGANLVIVSRNQQQCEKIAGEIMETGRDALAFAADLRQLASIKAMVEAAVAHFGRIDILLNNAGAAVTKPPEAFSEEDWDFVLDLNLKGAFFTAQQVGLQMIKQKQGKIINIASIFGFVGDGNIVSYCASKGGLILMTRALAMAWARYNIQVNALAPGYIVTEMNKETLSQDKVSQHLIRNIPVRKLGEVSDLVGAVVYMSSSASDYMTGQSIVIDGGWIAH